MWRNVLLCVCGNIPGVALVDYDVCVPLFQLCEAGADESTSRRVRESWCSCLLNACDEYLSHIILNEEASSSELSSRHSATTSFIPGQR